jgi:hypothetical protein
MYVKSCDTCQKHAVLKKIGKISIVTGYHLWLSVSAYRYIVLDIYGPELPKTVRGNRFVLVVIDIATPYMHAIALRNQKSETIANELLKLFTFIGLPESIAADGQHSLNSQLMTALHSQLHCKKCPYNYGSSAYVYVRTGVRVIRRLRFLGNTENLRESLDVARLLG